MTREAKDLLAKIFLGVASAAAAINVAWIIMLLDYSYAVLAAPISVVGAIALVGASILRWRTWHVLMVPALLVPYLPWVDWMYG